MAQHLPSSSIPVPPAVSLTVSSTTLTKQENENKKSFHVRRWHDAWFQLLLLCFCVCKPTLLRPSFGLCFCSLLRVNLWLGLLNRYDGLFSFSGTVWILCNTCLEAFCTWRECSRTYANRYRANFCRSLSAVHPFIWPDLFTSTGGKRKNSRSELSDLVLTSCESS